MARRPRKQQVVSASLNSLERATMPQGANAFGLNLADPLGIDAKTRGLAADRAARQDMAQRSVTEQNPLLATSAITGPLSDPNWAGFFQTLRDHGNMKLSGGPSPAGSNQITGQSVMPNWLPTSGAPAGVSPTGTATEALDALQTRTTPARPPMVDDDGVPMPTTRPAPQAPPAPKPPPAPGSTGTDPFTPFVNTEVLRPQIPSSSSLDALRRRGR